jgi:alpha-L-fucosidase
MQRQWRLGPYAIASGVVVRASDERGAMVARARAKRGGADVATGVWRRRKGQNASGGREGVDWQPQDIPSPSPTSGTRFHADKR